MTNAETITIPSAQEAIDHDDHGFASSFLQLANQKLYVNKTDLEIIHKSNNPFLFFPTIDQKQIANSIELKVKSITVSNAADVATPIIYTSGNNQINIEAESIDMSGSKVAQTIKKATGLIGLNGPNSKITINASKSLVLTSGDRQDKKTTVLQSFQGQNLNDNKSELTVNSPSLTINGNIFNGLYRTDDSDPPNFNLTNVHGAIFEINKTESSLKTVIKGDIGTLNAESDKTYAGISVTVTNWNVVEHLANGDGALGSAPILPNTGRDINDIDFSSPYTTNGAEAHVRRARSADAPAPKYSQFRNNSIHVIFRGDDSFLEGNVTDYYKRYVENKSSDIDRNQGEGTYLSFINGANWHLQGDSNRLAQLTLDNGKVYFPDGKTTHTLQIDESLTGSGTFVMHVDDKEGKFNDQILIKGKHSGNHKIIVTPSSPAPEDTAGNAKGLTLVRVAEEDKDAGFTVIQDTGLHSLNYSIEKKDDKQDGYKFKWVLGEAVLQSSTLTTSVDDLNRYDYELLRTEDTTLRERLSHMHTGTKEDGLWVRLDGYSRHDGATKDRLDGAVVGFDRRAENQALYGAFLRYGQGKSTIAAGTSKNVLTSLGAYYTRFDEQQRYIDVVVEAGRLTKKLDLASEGNWTANGHANRWLGTAAVEVGKTFEQGHGFIEPRARLTVGWLNSTDFTTSNDTKVTEKARFTALGRLGLQAGYRTDKNLFLNGTFDVLHDFGRTNGKTVTTNGNQSVETTLGSESTWLEAGVGMSWQLSHSVRVYGDIKRAYSGTFSNDWRWHVGLEKLF